MVNVDEKPNQAIQTADTGGAPLIASEHQHTRRA